MLRFLLSFRVNLAIAFLGAFAVMALIKLSTYLPGKYYFNFSKLFAGASEPFIVDPPSVTGAKLCALMSRHNLSADDIGRSIDCSAKMETAPSHLPKGAALFDTAQIDQLYALAFKLDAPLREQLASAGAVLNPQPMPPEELDKILVESGSVNEAFRGIWQRYDTPLRNQLSTAIRPVIQSTYAGLQERNSPASDQSPEHQGGPSLKGLTAQQSEAIRRAHAAFVQVIQAESIAANTTPVSKSAVDKIIQSAYSADSIIYGMTDYYRSAVTVRAEGLLRAKFAEAGVPPIEEKAAKELLFKELVKDGLPSYVIATAIRLMPVLLIGVMLGFVFGRAELFSAAFAGALAAFLLTWPILLMWDRIVQSSWHDKKLIFLGFYAVYIIAFFLTARAGALIGVRMREGAPARIAQSIDRETRSLPLTGASWGELAGNVAMGLIANGVVAAWNIVIPLSVS